MAFGESLLVRLGIDNRAFSRGMRGAERSVHRLRRILGTIGVGLSAAAFVGMARRATQFADEIAKAGKAAGITSEEIQKLRHAEEQAVGSSGQLEQGLQRLGRRMVSNEQNLNSLGVSTRDAEGNFLSVRQTLDNLADAIQGAESQAERLNIAQEAMGTQGRQLVPLLQQGAAGLKRFGDEADRAGRILDEDTIKQLEAAKQAIDDFGTRATIVMGNFLGLVLDSVEAFKTLNREMSDQESAEEEAVRRLEEQGVIRRQRDTMGRERGVLTDEELERRGMSPEQALGEGRREIDALAEQIRNERVRNDLLENREQMQEEMRSAEESQAKREQTQQQSRIDAAKEVARIFDEARRKREFQELPLTERILRTEKEIAQERARAEDDALAKEDRIRAAERVNELEDQLQEKQRKGAAQAGGFSLSELAQEAPGRIGTMARQAKSLMQRARSMEIRNLGRDPNARGTPVTTPEMLRERAEDIRAQLKQMGALEDEEGVFKRALRESEKRLGKIAENTEDLFEFRGGFGDEGGED